MVKIDLHVSLPVIIYLIVPRQYFCGGSFCILCLGVEFMCC